MLRHGQTLATASPRIRPYLQRAASTIRYIPRPGLPLRPVCPLGGSGMATAVAKLMPFERAAYRGGYARPAGLCSLWHRSAILPSGGFPACLRGEWVAAHVSWPRVPPNPPADTPTRTFAQSSLAREHWAKEVEMLRSRGEKAPLVTDEVRPTFRLNRPPMLWCVLDIAGAVRGGVRRSRVSVIKGGSHTANGESL